MEEIVQFAKLMAAAVVSIEMAAAAAFMPLEPGNSWVYRSNRWNQTLTIRVGLTPIMTNGNVYHKLTGYTPQPLWVRTDASGDLYYLDEDTQQDVLLTSFQSPMWQAAPKRLCSQEARVQAEPSKYSGPAGRYDSARVLEYRVSSCADAGIEQELYVENIGMVRRVETTIAGPLAFDLVQANVGPVTVAEQPGTSFRLGLREQPDVVIAHLRLAVEGGTPMKLTFHSGQEFDLILRDQLGREIWRWSDGRFFTMIIGEDRWRNQPHGGDPARAERPAAAGWNLHRRGMADQQHAGAPVRDGCQFRNPLDASEPGLIDPDRPGGGATIERRPSGNYVHILADRPSPQSPYEHAWTLTAPHLFAFRRELSRTTCS